MIPTNNVMEQHVVNILASYHQIKTFAVEGVRQCDTRRLTSTTENALL